MSDTENKKAIKFDKLDGGLVTLYPAHQLKANQSPNAKNFDVRNYGNLKTRPGYAKFTPSAKGSPTGTGISGLFAASQYNLGFQSVQRETSLGAFSDITSNFNNQVTGNLFTNTTSGGIFFAGSSATFTQVNITLTVVGVAGSIVWEYWSGAAWSTLTLTDGTAGLTASGVITFAAPGGWAATTVNSSASLFFIRARMTGNWGTIPSGYGSVVGAQTTVLAAEGTTVQPISSGSWGTPITGLTITLNTRVHMMMYNNKFLIGNQGGGPWKTVDAVSATALAGSPPANAIGGMIHRSRVWWYPGSSSTATFSGLNAEEDYVSADNAGSIVINNGDGMNLNGMASGGLFGVFSKISPTSGAIDGKIYILSGSSTFDFAVQKLADFGALGPDCLIGFDNLVIAATNRGVYVLQTQIPTKISQNIKPTYDAIVAQTAIAIGKYQTTLRISYASSSTNDSQLIVDLERGIWGYNITKPFSRYANHPNGNVLAGDVGAALVYTDDSGTSDNGGAIVTQWDTKAEDFGLDASPKHLAEIDLHAENTGNWNISVTHLIDGVDTALGATMNPSTEGPVKRLSRTFNKRGKLHQIRLTSPNVASQPITVDSITVWGEIFNPGTK